MLVKLHPIDRDTITFTDQGINLSTSGYYIQRGTINLNETERVSLVYSKRDSFNTTPELVDITFEVIPFSPTRSGLIKLVESLKYALNNSNGGEFEYRPDNITTLSTYYRYVMSPIPEIDLSNISYWDNNPAAGNCKYFIKLNITLKTHPIGYSPIGIEVWDSQVFDPVNDTYMVLDSTDCPYGDVEPVFGLVVNKDYTDYPTTLTCWTKVWTKYGNTNSVAPIYAFKTSDYVDYDGDTWTFPVAPSNTLEVNNVAKITWLDTSEASITLESTTDGRSFSGKASLYAILKTENISSQSTVRIQSGLVVNGTVVYKNPKGYSPKYINTYHSSYIGDIIFPRYEDSGNVSGNYITDIKLWLSTTNPGTEAVYIDSILVVFQDDGAIKIDVPGSIPLNEMNSSPESFYLMPNFKYDQTLTFGCDVTSSQGATVFIETPPLRRIGTRHLTMSRERKTSLFLYSEKSPSVVGNLSDFSEEFSVEVYVYPRTIYPFAEE